MILVTCGTNEQPFDRLVRAAHTLGGDERLVVQHGSSQVEHGMGEWMDFVSFEVLAELMREARVVISHAGVGSIMLARRSSKTPIVVPRRVHLGEAVDDHQLPLARRLHERGMVRLIEDEATLPVAVQAVAVGMSSACAEDLPGAAALAADLRSALDRLLIPLVVANGATGGAATSPLSH